jgi:hypothetical protein
MSDCIKCNRHFICRITGYHGGGYEEFYHLGYTTVQSVESQLTFQRNIVASILRAEEQAKQETDVKQVASRGTFICLVHIGTRRNK